jgi:hypothetical protein
VALSTGAVWDCSQRYCAFSLVSSGEFGLKLSTAEQRRVRRVTQKVETAPLPWLLLVLCDLEYAMGMWKYILACTLLVIGLLEIVLALHRDLREAVMQTSPVRLKQAESPAFLLAGISALVMGIGILFYGLFW